MTETKLKTRGADIILDDLGRGERNLVFLHYWGGSARTWTDVIRALEDDCRCVALSQRGWGRSEARDDRYDLEAMADDVEDVVAALGLGPFVLVGHSMGGKVAQVVASRGRTDLKGLVLVAPAPPYPVPIAAGQRDAMRAAYGSAEGVRHALGILTSRPLSDAQRDRVVADSLAGTAGAKEAWVERDVDASLSDRVGDFKGPVSIVVGNQDKVEPQAFLRSAFAAVLPQARIEVVPGVGHLVPIESPDEVAKACRRIAFEVFGGSVVGDI